MRKYKKIDLPFEAWKNFKLKQEKIKKRVELLTGKYPKVPLTKIIVAQSKVPLWLDDKEILELNKKKHKRKI